MPKRNGRLFTLALALACSAFTLMSAAARADEFLDKVNGFYAQVPADKHSETILLPLLAKMAPPPAVVNDHLKAALVPASVPSFAAVAEWCTGDTQKAVLDALKKVTEEQDFKKAYAFAQPYGTAKIDPDVIGWKLYTELGDPPTLAAADFLYLNAIRNVACLCHAEATRLAADGKPNEALEVLVHLMDFSRQMCDREFYKEKFLGMEMLTLTLIRLRDVAYVDSRSESPKLTAENIRDLIVKLRDKDGYLGIDRLRLPRADQVAGEQLISRIMLPDGGPNPDTFAPTLARIAARDHPLRLFSEMAKWDAIRTVHGKEKDSREALNAVYGDWSQRWQLDPFNALLKVTPAYETVSKAQYAAVVAIVGNIDNLFLVRRIMKMELIGTKSALAVYGFVRQNQSFPPSLEATRPRIIRPQDLEVDPFAPAQKELLQYFVPGRSQPNLPKTGTTHKMQVFPEYLGRTYPNFSVELDDDQFVVFSVGPNGVKNGMRRATQMVEDDKGDYLVWPPVMSLIRKDLAERDRFK